MNTPYTYRLKKDRGNDKYYIQEEHGPNYRYVLVEELVEFIEKKIKEGYIVEILPNTPTE